LPVGDAKAAPRPLFVVINFVLDRGYRRRGEGKPRGAIEVEHETLTGVALMNAFLGLFLSATQYSLLAGENGCALTGGRASSAELLRGISFVASVYMLLYAVVQFVSGSAETLAKHCVFIPAGGPERGAVVADRCRGRLRRAGSAFGAGELVGNHRSIETLELQRLLSDARPIR
jgi:hypothetical protein